MTNWKPATDLTGMKFIPTHKDADSPKLPISHPLIFETRYRGIPHFYVGHYDAHAKRFCFDISRHFACEGEVTQWHQFPLPDDYEF